MKLKRNLLILFFIIIFSFLPSIIILSDNKKIELKASTSSFVIISGRVSSQIINDKDASKEDEKDKLKKEKIQSGNNEDIKDKKADSPKNKPEKKDIKPKAKNGEQGLKDVSIIVAGTNISTVTDIKGDYELKIPRQDLISLHIVLYAVKKDFDIASQEVLIVDRLLKDNKYPKKVDFVLTKNVWKEKRLKGQVKSPSGRSLQDVQLLFTSICNSKKFTTNRQGSFSVSIRLPDNFYGGEIVAEKYGYKITTQAVSFVKKESYTIKMPYEKGIIMIHGLIFEKVEDEVRPLTGAVVELSSKKSHYFDSIRHIVRTDSNGYYTINTEFFILDSNFNLKIRKDKYLPVTQSIDLLKTTEMNAELAQETKTIVISGMTKKKKYPTDDTAKLANVTIMATGQGFRYETISSINGNYSLEVKVPLINPQVKITAKRENYLEREHTFANLIQDKEIDVILEPELTTNNLVVTVFSRYLVNIDSPPLEQLKDADIKLHALANTDTDSPDELTLEDLSTKFGKTYFTFVLPKEITKFDLTISKKNYITYATTLDNNGSASDSRNIEVTLDYEKFSHMYSGKFYFHDPENNINFPAAGFPVKVTPEIRYLAPQNDCYVKHITTNINGNYSVELEIYKEYPQVEISADLPSYWSFSYDNVRFSATELENSTGLDVIMQTRDSLVYIQGTTTPRANITVKGYKLPNGEYLLEKSGVADSSGNFSVSFYIWMEAGEFDIFISKPDYYSRIIQKSADLTNATKKYVQLGDVSLTEVPLTRTIQGTVCDQGGSALAGVIITDGKVSTTTASNGTYSLTIITGLAHFNINISATKDYYHSQSQIADLEGDNLTFNFTLQLKTNLVHFDGCMDIGFRDADESNFKISCTGNNNTYIVYTDAEGNYSLDIPLAAYNEPVFNFIVEKEYYETVTEQIDIREQYPQYELFDTISIFHIFRPQRKKVTKQITINIRGDYNDPLDLVSCELSGYCYYKDFANSFNEKLTTNVTLQEIDPNLTINLRRLHYEDYKTTINILNQQTLDVKMIPEYHDITISGVFRLGAKLEMENVPISITIRDQTKHVYTAADGKYSATFHMPKTSKLAVVQCPESDYYPETILEIPLDPDRKNYTYKCLHPAFKTKDVNIIVTINKNTYGSVGGCMQVTSTPFYNAKLLVNNPELNLILSCQPDTNKINTTIQVPLMYPEVTFTATGPGCASESEIVDFSDKNDFYQAYNLIYQSKQIVTCYTPHHYMSGGGKLFNVGIADGYWYISDEFDGGIKVGVVTAIAGGASLIGYRYFSHCAMKTGKAWIIMKVRWRYNTQYTTGSAFETFDVILDINGQRNSMLMDMNFSILLPGASEADYFELALEGVQAITDFFDIAFSKPDEYTEVLFIIEKDLVAGGFYQMYPGFLLKSSSAIGGSGAYIEGFIDGVMIIEGAGNYTAEIEQWLIEGGDYSRYTGPTPMIIKEIVNFATMGGLEWSEEVLGN